MQDDPQIPLGGAKDFVLSDKDLGEFVEMAVSCLNDQIEQKPTGITPYFFVAYRRKEDFPAMHYAVASLFMVDWNDNETRRKVTRSLAAKIFEDSGIPVAVSLLSEAWTSKIPVGEKMKQMPSQDPNREEVVMVAAMAIDGRNSVRIAPMIRTDNVITAGEFETSNQAIPFLLQEFFTEYASLILAKQVSHDDSN